MKPKLSVRRFLLPACSSLLALPVAHAVPLTWDANGTGAGQTNGGGAWLGANLWWNGSANQNWVDGSDATVGGPNTAGGTVTLASPTTVGSITFNTFTGTYTPGSLGQPITLNSGITMNAGSGAVSLSASSFILGAAQTWTNNSSSSLTSSVSVNNGGNLLTIDNIGTIFMKAGIISGSGGLTKSGTGLLEIGGQTSNVAHSFTGTITLNGGVMRVSANLPSGNLTLNGGVLEHYWSETISRTLGNAVGQVRLPGGASGFSQNGNGTIVTLNNNNTNPVVWGGTYFNPSTLVLQAATAQAGGGLTFTNKLDLNGETRTIQVAKTTSVTTGASMTGVISNGSGTAAGLTKTGPGLLVLTAANTYNGGTTIEGGILRFADKNAMPATGNVTVNDGATLSVGVGTGNLWTTGTSGNATLGGLLSGLGGLSGSTVSYSGNVNLGIEVASGTQTYAGTIGDVGTSLGISKTGGGTFGLTGSGGYSGKTTVLGGVLSFDTIGNVGGGNSALGAPATIASGTLNVGHVTVGGTLRYTGSGHTSDRVINLSGTTGGATLEASGTGAWILTSAPTATAVGAKTLTLTGTNTAANTLPTTALPGFADVLTIQKSGAGTWWVNGFTSPKNAWSVTAGTLVVAGGITTGDQQVTVSGGTLAGSGPITLQSTKSLIVQAAGSLSPGHDTIGTLTVTGILDIAAMAGGTGKLNFQMAAPGASDMITVSGTAKIGTGVLGFSDFVFTDLGGMTSNTYVLLTATGGITGTIDPANRNGTIGSISGSLQINGNNLEFTSDQDGDGMPDAFELANTTPPSAIAFNPGDDLDNDGSTNLQEYLAGTEPNNYDSDADGFKDGYETKTGTWVSANNTGTDPLKFDTDGDTIRDGYETNTGTYVSSSDPGTNPNKTDTDEDGLKDNVETNTDTYVSTSDTGTHPLLADSDADGAGDWYEIAIIDKKPALGSPPNSPNDANLKPNIPYPLPAPDTSTGATNKPVKVYIMSGQSNMVGFGQIAGSGPGTLQTMTGAENKFPNLVASGGGWTSRKDVKYQGVISDVAKGDLKPDVAGDKYGPELGFGYVMGWYHDEPVLLIKASQGNRGLMWDFLPPGSPRTVAGATTYPSYGESPETWTTGIGPSPFVWYAGKQYDDCFLKESDMGASIWATAVSYPAACQIRLNGVSYISKAAHTSGAASEPGVGANWQLFWDLYSVFNTADILDNFASEYPAWAAQGFEIAGFVWWQGYDDTGEPRATRYEPNMVQFIKQIRTYYENRYPTKTVPNAPFVIATLAADGGWGNTAAGYAKVAQAQLNADGTAGIYPEFAGNVKTIEARGFWRDSTVSPNGQGYHYNWNAETYLLVGDALGRAMVDLESVTPSVNTFANWMTSYGVAPGLAGFDQDSDGDGIKNGVESFFGTNPTSSSSGLVSGAASGNTFTFTHPQNATPADGVTGAYRWSKDLSTFRSHGQTDGDNTTVNFNAVTNAGITTVTATVTGTATAKLFVDVKVTQN